MAALFDPARILSRNTVPEIFCHGPRQIELLAGDIVCVWLCQDQPASIAGLAAMSVPVAKVLIPINCYAWNVVANMEWSLEHGVMCRKPIGPTLLRPSRTMMS